MSPLITRIPNWTCTHRRAAYPRFGCGFIYHLTQNLIDPDITTLFPVTRLYPHTRLPAATRPHHRAVERRAEDLDRHRSKHNTRRRQMIPVWYFQSYVSPASPKRISEERGLVRVGRGDPSLHWRTLTTDGFAWRWEPPIFYLLL